MMTKIPCKAIIFDFDGTLADSMPFLERIGVMVMMKYYDVSKEEATQRYRSTTGLPYEHQIKNNFPKFSQNEMAIEEFEQLKIEKIYEQELFSDAQETIEKVQNLGLDIFVSSSTFQPTMVEYFRRRGMADSFKDILGYRPGFEKGVHHFKFVESKYNFPLTELVFVGDSLKDYERSRGFCSFIAKQGMFKEKDFRRIGHTGPVVPDLISVPNYLTPL